MKKTVTLKILIIGLMATSLLFTSCKDDESVVIDLDQLTGDEWAYASIEANLTDEGLEILKAFFEGTRYTFKADGTYDQFDPIFESNSEGTWEAKDNTLTMDPGDEFETIYTIKECSKTTLKLEESITNEDTNTSYAYTITFTR